MRSGYQGLGLADESGKASVRDECGGIQAGRCSSPMEVIEARIGRLCRVAVVLAKDAAKASSTADRSFISRDEFCIKNHVVLSNASVRAMLVVVNQPLPHNEVQLALTEAHEVIKHLALRGADEAFTEDIGFGLSGQNLGR